MRTRSGRAGATVAGTGAAVQSGAMGMSGPWAVPSHPPAGQVGPPARPVAARQAPLAFALLLVHPFPTLAFTLWAVDGLLHCDDSARVTCHLGFAPHLLLPAVVGVGVAVVVGIVGVVAHPRSRRQAWLWLLVPTGLTWLTLWWALAVTAEPGPAPWYDPPTL